MRNSCLSSAVSATYLSEEKLVKMSARYFSSHNKDLIQFRISIRIKVRENNISRFFFKSFSMGRNIRKKENISCDVKLCVLGSSCPFAKTNRECDSDEPGYDYKPFGDLKRNANKITIWRDNEIIKSPRQ